jgi:hypothetical protein
VSVNLSKPDIIYKFIQNSPESEILYESSSESESELGTFSMSYNSAYCDLNILIHCLMVNIQLIELNPEGTQIIGSDSRPSGDKKRKRSKERQYQHVSEMTKDLKEALRVNKIFAVFFIFYKFTDNNIF